VIVYSEAPCEVHENAVEIRAVFWVFFKRVKVLHSMQLLAYQIHFIEN
jgi:hypothetical protein